jgi:protein tyrosine/serine phosphatase
MYRSLRQSSLARRAFTAQLLVLLLVGLAARTAPAQSGGTHEVGIKNFGRVNENYYRGSQPGEVEFAELKRLGVKTIIDLRKDRLEEAEGWARAQGLEYVNIPLTTKRPATDEQTEAFLKLVNDPANWPVYVHCAGGRHRTGQMTAIYRITKDGWTAEESYREMKRYDFEDSFFYPRSLKRYVFDFYKRHGAEKATKGQAPEPAAATAQ